MFAQEEAIIEAILFISSEGISLKKIAEIINRDKKTTENILNELSKKYNEQNRGIQLICTNDLYQFCTKPEFFEYISKLEYSSEKQKLTPPLLETLAIIAYKQPITRSQIEEIRGVSCEHVINKLIEYKLILEVGRMETTGKPILFGTSEEFLKHLGFSSLEDLKMPENLK